MTWDILGVVLDALWDHISQKWEGRREIYDDGVSEVGETVVA